MSVRVTLSQVNKCFFTIAKPTTVELNPKARLPAYLLSLTFAPELLEEHRSLYKKKLYSSSAQITTQHLPEELEASLILTLINFPRKQIGPKMSDCLVCGVVPSGPGVDLELKRTSTVFVRPFLDFLTDASISSYIFGAPVGVFPTLESKRLANPRDLDWGEFEMIQYLVGSIQELHVVPDSVREGGFVRCDGMVDFGSLRGILKSSSWFRSESIQDGALLKSLEGRQVIAVTNLDSSDAGDLFDVDTAAVLTVNGFTTIEPAKRVENGFRLA